MVAEMKSENKPENEAKSGLNWPGILYTYARACGRTHVAEQASAPPAAAPCAPAAALMVARAYAPLAPRALAFRAARHREAIFVATAGRRL